MPAVSRRLKNSYKGVVHDQAGDTCEINPEICDRIRHHRIRRSHPLKEQRSQKDTQNRHGNAAHKSDCHSRMYGKLCFLLLPRTDIVRNHHTRADRNAIEEPDQKKNQVSDTADGRKRTASFEISHNQGVYRIVKLLKKIADEHRDRKTNDPLSHRSLCHQVAIICCSLCCFLLVAVIRCFPLSTVICCFLLFLTHFSFQKDRFSLSFLRAGIYGFPSTQCPQFRQSQEPSPRREPD